MLPNEYIAQKIWESNKFEMHRKLELARLARECPQLKRRFSFTPRIVSLIVRLSGLARFNGRIERTNTDNPSKK